MTSASDLLSKRLDGPRSRFVRMWRILVLLRQRPRSLAELAQMLSTSERTIRRDLYALQRVPLPITSRYPIGVGAREGVRSVDQNEWCLEECAVWPRQEVAPIADVQQEVRS